IAQHARHKLARSARSNRHPDGRAKIALLDFAAAPGSDRARMPSANDRQSFARAGPARFESDGIEIDPRYRTRGRAIESGFRQRARSGCVESIASTNPKTKNGSAENARSSRLRQGFYCGGRRLACNILQRAAGTAATTEFVNPTIGKRDPRDAGAAREIDQGIS